MNKLNLKSLSKIEHKTFYQSLVDTMQMIKDRKEDNNNRYFLNSSLESLDNQIGKFSFGDYYVIGGRPGTGKSAFLNQIIVDFFENNKDTENLCVIYFNFEMSNKSQSVRFMSRKTLMEYNKILSVSSKIDDQELQRLDNAKKYLQNFNVVFIEQPLTPEGIESVIENIITDNPTYKFVVALDHSRLPLKRGLSEMDMINNLSKVMMRTKTKYNTINILLSQLNRKIESTDRMKDYFRPVLSDLFNSDAVGQDADSVMLLYNPESYGIKTIPTPLGKLSTANKIFLEVVKCRNGTIGPMMFNRDYRYGRITDVKRGQE